MSEDLMFTQHDENIFPATSSVSMGGNVVSRCLSSRYIDLIRTRASVLDSVETAYQAGWASGDVQGAQTGLTAVYSTSASLFPWVHASLWSFQPESLDAFRSLLAVRERALERMRDLSIADDAPIYEAEPQSVDLDRLRRIRGIGAHETEDLYDWYAQKEE